MSSKSVIYLWDLEIKFELFNSWMCCLLEEIIKRLTNLTNIKKSENRHFPFFLAEYNFLLNLKIYNSFSGYNLLYFSNTLRFSEFRL